MGDTFVAVGGDAAGASAIGPVRDPVLAAAKVREGELESE
jgi:hypothetical protein